MASQPSSVWDKTKTGGKEGWQKLYSLVNKLGPPVNKLSNKLGSEAFWPTSMDKECDKAARILRSFCKDGFYKEEERPSVDAPQAKQKVLKKIPSDVIKNCIGVAIFTTMRTGLWISGSGGSGILVARKADGSWSPPSGIQVQTMGLGFLVGIDIYDCVLIINTQKALDAFTRFRTTIGGDLAVTAGPVGAGAVVETEVTKRQAPIFTYMKSRGFYAGVAIDGTVIIERVDENERFYHSRIPAQDILQGKVRAPYEARGLLETLKAAEGDMSADASFIPDDLPPSDYEIQQDGHVFSVPDKDDPDPYGVLQLEKEGLVIREAGTQKRASWDQFTFAPSATSPLFDTFDNRKVSKGSRASIVSRRSSGMPSPNINGPNPIGVSSYRRGSNDGPRTPGMMSDAGTQTDDRLPLSPNPSGRWGILPGGSRKSSMEDIPEDENTITLPKTRGPNSEGNWEEADLNHPHAPKLPLRSAEEEHHAVTDEVHTNAEHHIDPTEEDDDDEEHEEAVIVEAPVTHSVHRTITPQVTQKARLVEMPKRGPPPSLPPRNPNRQGTNGDRPLSQLSAGSGSSANAMSARISGDGVRSSSEHAAAKEDELQEVDLDEPPKIVLEDHDEVKHDAEETAEDATATETEPESHAVEPVAEEEDPKPEPLAEPEVEPAEEPEASKETAEDLTRTTTRDTSDVTPAEPASDPWKRILQRHESMDDVAAEKKAEEPAEHEAATHSGRASPEIPGSFD